MGCSASKAQPEQPTASEKDKYSPQMGSKKKARGGKVAENDYLLNSLKKNDGKGASKSKKDKKDPSGKDAKKGKREKKESANKRDEVYEKKRAAFMARKAEGGNSPAPKLNMKLPQETNSNKSTARSARKSGRDAKSGNITQRRESNWQQQREAMKKQLKAAKKKNKFVGDLGIEIFVPKNSKPPSRKDMQDSDESDDDSEDDSEEDSEDDSEDDSESEDESESESESESEDESDEESDSEDEVSTMDC